MRSTMERFFSGSQRTMRSRNQCNRMNSPCKQLKYQRSRNVRCAPNPNQPKTLASPTRAPAFSFRSEPASEDHDEGE